MHAERVQQADSALLLERLLNVGAARSGGCRHEFLLSKLFFTQSTSFESCKQRERVASQRNALCACPKDEDRGLLRPLHSVVAAVQS